jgi:hypothetical protein
MNELSFSQLRRILFIAANYTRLQGLRALPLAFLLFAVTFWANWERGPVPRPLHIPLLLSAVSAGLYWLIDGYYKRAFGQAVQAPQGHLYWVFLAAGALLALIAFIIDVTLQLPFIIVGIVMGAGLLIDYLMLVRITQVWYMPIYPLFGLSIIFVSVLPVFGLEGWWTVIGARSHLLGVIMSAGLIMTAAAVVSHIVFTRALPKEAPNG